MSSRLRVFSVATAAVVGAMGLSSASSAALITYDVRVAETGSSAGITRVDSKHVVASAVGDVVKLELYALLDDGSLDGNSANDGVSAAGGSFKSGVGGLLGNLGSGSIVSAFQGTGFSNGTSQDLDADTDSDLGSNSTASTTAFYIARTNNGSNPVVGTELLLGTAEFAVTSLDPAGTTINFTPAALTGGTVASRNYHIFTIDGTSYIRTGAGATAADVGFGDNVVVAVPEPAALGLLGLAAIGLAGRRRPSA